jgi:hypothetical protein
LKEWTTPDFRNTPSTTNLEGEDSVDALEKGGNASMPEQVKRPNAWRRKKKKKKKMMMMMSRKIRHQDGGSASGICVPLIKYHYAF